MIPVECIVEGCSTSFTDKRGVDSHFGFTDRPPHPRSKIPRMKTKIDRERGNVSSDRYPSNWPAIRQRILSRDDYTCQTPTCETRGGPHGSAELHIHHETPLSEGGSNDPDTLVTLCSGCHGDEHGRPIGSGGGSRNHSFERNGDDLLVRCGICSSPATLQRNRGPNLVICETCSPGGVVVGRRYPDQSRSEPCASDRETVAAVVPIRSDGLYINRFRHRNYI
jgi:5-methylcytosine-specific restriction endonuclease McrA